MPDVLQNPGTAVLGHPSGPTERRSEVEPGTIFVKSSSFSTLSRSVRSEAKPFGSWILVSNVDREAAEQELVEAGTLVTADSLIEASAFGCDSTVLERAVNRALQKAADDELDALEITGVTLRQDSGLDYVSIFARARTFAENPYWPLLDTE